MAEASPEAREALAAARNAKASAHAALPVAQRLHEQLMVAMTENHFADLFERVMLGPHGGPTVDLR